MKPAFDTLLTQAKFELAARIILGGVFVYASIHKILDPSSFAKIIYGYDILPGALINLAAIILPFVECFTGVFLILGIWPRSAAILINAMLGVFIVAISYNLIRGHEFDCGCFSINQDGYTSSSVELLVRDVFWFVVGMIPILFQGIRITLFSVKET